jgi:hypothetical protein
MSSGRMRRIVSCAGVFLAVIGVNGVRQANAQSCNHWSSMFPGDGFLEKNVNALTFHRSELYLAGEFDTCMSSRTVNYVARWNGHRWARVGAGLYDPVVYRFAYALAEDPNTPGGPTLYAGTADGVFREPNDPDDPNEPWHVVGATDAPVYALATYQGRSMRQVGSRASARPIPTTRARHAIRTTLTRSGTTSRAGMVPCGKTSGAVSSAIPTTRTVRYWP